MATITCFGEILYDVFPAHEKIGGAPLNVAVRLRSFGNDVKMISAIGHDRRGKDLLDFLEKHHISVEHIELLNEYKTGKVKVMLNEKGSASYNIMYPRAWDKINISEAKKKVVRESDAFVFGSLVARDEISRKSLYELVDNANYKIFDLNLRPPYYTLELLQDLMNKADFIKFNDDELYEVARAMGSKYYSLEQNIKFIASKTNTNNICVTKGAHGAVLMYGDALYYNSGFLIKVVDTVGAGDSFLASLLSKLLNGSEPQTAIDFACAVGALVAKCEGANPQITDDEILNFMNP